MPIRDFTAATKATLLSAMKEIEEQDKRFWIFSGVIDTVDDWFIKDKVSAYEGDIAAYHKAILDKKDTSKAQLEAIWRDVYQVDGQYARDFQGMSDHIADLTSSVQSLTDALNPEAPSATGGIPAILRSPDELKSILKPFRSTEYTIDHRMQEQVFAILAEDRFSRETWNNATVAEREAILQELYRRVQEILGTSAAARINFAALGEPGELIRFGQYVHKDRRITLNSDLLTNDDDSYRLMGTVVHELRHAYQHEAVDASGGDTANHVVSTKTVQVWKDNYEPPEHYIPPDPNNMGPYLQQPVEWDAKGFASQELDGLTPVYKGSW